MGRTSTPDGRCARNVTCILYVPAHAHYRQAGPLPADTAAAVRIAEERVKAGQGVEKKDLDSKNIALQGAEDSLLRQLEKVRNLKDKRSKRGNPPATREPPMPRLSLPTRRGTGREGQGCQPKTKPGPASVSSSSGEEPVKMDVSKEAKKKVTKRESAIPAEEYEQKEKDGSPKSSKNKEWANVTP